MSRTQHPGVDHDDDDGGGGEGGGDDDDDDGDGEDDENLEHGNKLANHGETTSAQVLASCDLLIINMKINTMIRIKLIIMLIIC